MNHYIRADDRSRILEGWSDGLNQSRDPTNFILVAESKHFQFYLPGFEELGMNPPLYTEDLIPMYYWDGAAVVQRTAEEIEADRALLPMPEPVKSPAERLDALEAAIERGLSL